MIISIFIPHGGCPERCHFCDQKVSGGEPVPVRQITQTIESHLASAPNKKHNEEHVEVAFYGGTFTALSRALQLRYLEAVRPFLEKNQVHSVRLATRPDCIEEDWILFLKEKYFLSTVELGVQSFNPLVLKNLGRTHCAEHVEQSVCILKRLGIQTSLHLLIGCPGETEQEDQTTLTNIFHLRPHFVRIHPLLVIEGTELEVHYKQKKFSPISLKEAVIRAATLTEALENKGIKVIRLGLQTNELLNTSVVAGPYDPGFGDRVRTQILKKQIENRILNQFHDIKLRGQNLEISLPQKELIALSGYQKEYLTELKETFELSELSLKKDNEIKIRLSHSHRTS